MNRKWKINIPEETMLILSQTTQAEIFLMLLFSYGSCDNILIFIIIFDICYHIMFFGKCGYQIFFKYSTIFAAIF